MLTVQEKKDIVGGLVSQIKDASAIYLGDFTGITVANLTELRVKMREKGIKVRVVKNTLLGRALKEANIEGLGSYLVKPTTLILANSEDPIEPAKVITEYHKSHEGLLPIKVVEMSGAQYDGSKIAELSKMPGKRELQAQIISLALGPGATLVGLLKGPGGVLAGQVKALVEKLEKN